MATNFCSLMSIPLLFVNYFPRNNGNIRQYLPPLNLTPRLSTTTINQILIIIWKDPPLNDNLKVTIM